MNFNEDFWNVQREMTDEALAETKTAIKKADARRPRWRRWLAMLGFVLVSSSGMFYGCWKSPTRHCFVNLAYGLECHDVPSGV